MASEYESVDLVPDRTVLAFTGAVVVAALTAAFAQVTVPYPFTSLPFTLQTVGVYLAGLVLGPVWGAFSLVLYTVAGVVGAPVFAGGASGLGVLTGPSGGYVLSFPLAAGLIGAIAHRRVTPRRLDSVAVPLQVGALLAGLAVVYLLGSVRFAMVLEYTLVEGLIAGGLVFVPGDVLKAIAVMGLVVGGHLAGLADPFAA